MIVFNTARDKIRFVAAARSKQTGSMGDPLYINDDLTVQRRKAYKSFLELKKRGLIKDVKIVEGNFVIKSNDYHEKTSQPV